MSGGVDSSVAACLLKEQGYEVIGLFMRTGVHGSETSAAEGSHKKGCCSALDAGDARRVADRLDIPFYALDFEQDFHRIIDYFADEYLAGRTPNPCVVCNTWLKFGKLWEYGLQLQADFIATGHYAQVVRREDQVQLHQGSIPTRTSRMSCSGSTERFYLICFFPLENIARKRCGPWHVERGLESTTSRTASRSALCRRGIMRR